MVFTDNKNELRASIEQSGERGLALEMKLSAPESSQHHGLREHLPDWTRRALAASERVRLHKTFTQHNGHRAQKISGATPATRAHETFTPQNDHRAGRHKISL